jgi:hypothetical protein
MEIKNAPGVNLRQNETNQLRIDGIRRVIRLVADSTRPPVKAYFNFFQGRSRLVLIDQ